MSVDATIQQAIAQLETERKKIDSKITALRAVLKPGIQTRTNRAGSAGSSTRRRSRRRKMSAAQKRAVSLRMKKYWAERKKAKK